MRAEAGAFTLYVVLRFVVSVGVGTAVLFVLFPTLVVLFSGAIIVAALILLTLQVVGVAWVWTPLTVVLAALAVLVLTGLLLILLSVAGMPGQVFLQGFGMRFVASRVPALDALWRTPRLSSPSG
jgi:signal transduction histidine kinase